MKVFQWEVDEWTERYTCGGVKRDILLLEMRD